MFSEWDALPLQKLLGVSETAVVLSLVPAQPPALCWHCKVAHPPDRPVWAFKPGADCSYGIFLRIISWLISLSGLTAGKMSGVNSGLGLEREASFSLFKLMWSCITSFSAVLQNPSNTSQEQWAVKILTLSLLL